MATNALGTTTAGIVLTGGQSRRMGTPKAALVVDGVTMLDRAIGALNGAGIDRVVIAGSELPDPNSTAADYEPQGPMAGIVSGWRHLGETHEPESVVVLSCDLPAIPASVVQGLLQASVEHEHGAVAHDGERPQPLIAVYKASALDHMTAAFDAGERSVRRCFADWSLGVLQFERQLLLDADTPEDLSGFDVHWPSP